jgi:hypothetical protein
MDKDELQGIASVLSELKVERRRGLDFATNARARVSPDAARGRALLPSNTTRR